MEKEAALVSVIESQWDFPPYRVPPHLAGKVRTGT